MACDGLDSLFQGDPLLHAVSPVDVPTFTIPVDRAPTVPWGDAARHCIVVFVDDDMYLERTRWRQWLDDLVTAAERHGARILGVSATPGLVGNLSPKAGDAEAQQRKRDILGGIVQAALLELLRWRHDRARISAAKATGMVTDADEVLFGPPELATLPTSSLGHCYRVVHADPALPGPERELLTDVRPDVTVVSLTEALAGRPVRGNLPRWRLALSISDPPDLADRGLCPEHIDRLWSRLALQLLLADFDLAYGGDLRSNGYTERLRDLVMSLAGLQAGPPDDAVHCYLGWPIWTKLTGEDVRCWPLSVQLHQLPEPTGLPSSDPAPVPNWTTPAAQLAWTVAMRAMRERMARDCHARVMVGGQLRAVSPVPGLVDELTTFLDLGKPVYLLGGFGGMTAVLVEALRGRSPPELTLDYQDDSGRRTEIRKAIDAAVAGSQFFAEDTPIACTPTDFPGLVRRLAATGPAGLNNGLDDQENARCFTTRDPVQAISLVLRGLTRLRPAAP